MSYRGKYSSGPEQQSYDRYMAHNEQSTIHKIKESYWTTKQYMKRKLGKKEDEHVVASDSMLDSKLSVFKAIQKSSMDLLRCIEKYQDRLCALSQEENTMGRFLKNETQHDKTRAGKMMNAVGKAQSHASQQRLALRVPLVRLFQEVETFRYRAISDTLMTINRMEAARTEYRGALLWMKDASEELDPDTYKQLEKFRKVQAQVKKTKARFDKLKLDTMQKIDLLAASRCNMFSHVLVTYQTTLLHFWEKTSRTHTAVAESFKGYQYFEFNLLKELSETTKKLADDSSPRDVPERDTDSQGLYSDSEEDTEKDGELRTKRTLKQLPGVERSEKTQGSEKPLGLGLNSADALLGLYTDEIESEHPFHSRLIDFDGEKQNGVSQQLQSGSMSNLFDTDKKQTADSAEPTSFIDFGDEEEESIEEIKRKQDEEFDISGGLFKSSKDDKKKPKEAQGNQDLLTEEFEPDESDKDDLTLLNEILNAPSTGEDEFSREWQAVFGDSPLNPVAMPTPAEPDKPKAGATFMPSNLLDLGGQMANMNMNQGAGPRQIPPNQIPPMARGMMTMPPQQQQQQTMGGGRMLPGGMTPARPGMVGGQPPTQKQLQEQVPRPTKSKAQKADMSAWFNLFADLDPLSNPDAVGSEQEAMGGGAL